MADIHSKEVRSYNMSRIRGRDTKPEIKVRKFLHSAGFRYRLHVKDLPGKPDIVLPRYKTVIFIHGCFWHGHESCPYFVIPKTRTDWWVSKINGNQERDLTAIQKLIEAGWKVLICWECELKKNVVKNTLNGLAEKIRCQ